jgi:predicted ATPase
MGAAIGREFSYELLASVSPLPEEQLQEALGQLVEAELVFPKGRPPDAVYTFKHALVQDTAYASLLKSRRQQLHARIAQALEKHFSKDAEEKPDLLAHHFARAGLLEKAVAYHEQAGRRALARSGIGEALAQFEGALECLAGMPPTRDRSERELLIHLAMGSAHVAISGFAAPATGRAYKRAAELCEELGETRQLFPVLYGLCLYHLYGAELPEAAVAADRLLKLAEPSKDDGLAFFAHRAVGVSALPAGEFAKARAHLDRALALYDSNQHKATIFVYAFDPRVVCLDYLSRALLPLGFIEHALAASDAAVAEARRVSHQNSLALPLFFGSVLRQILGDRVGVRERCSELADIAAEAGFRFWQAGATIMRGWTLADTGDLEAGRREIDRGVEEWRATGANYMLPYFIALKAQIELKAGNHESAVRLLEEASGRIEKTGERWFAAEILRLRGDVLIAIGRNRLADAQSCFLRALETAVGQEARFWELRAALGLARTDPLNTTLHERVAQLCSGFREGFDFPELKAAQVLTAQIQAIPSARASGN